MGALGMEDRRQIALVAEDEDMLAEVVEWTLEDAGYDVIRASDGEAALASLQEGGRIDLLVTDIRMPGRYDGWTLAEKVRDQMPDVPVVYMSGYNAVAPRSVPKSIFVSKPFRPEQLIAAIAKVA